MKKTFALAACATLSLAIAACGDDDDDASGDGAGSEPAAVTVDDGDETSPSPVDSAPAETGAPTEDSGTAVEISEEQAADCDAFEELNESLPDVEVPAVGEEVDDEYKDDARSAIEQLEELDLQSDEAQAARDSLIDDINAVIDADTMTEELAALGASEELIAFGEICAAGAGG